MTPLTPFERELASLVVESLNLEHDPNAVDPAAPLYRDGLGLDSIDLLELSVVIARRYGVQIKSDDPDITAIFSSLRALAETIEKRRIL